MLSYIEYYYLYKEHFLLRIICIDLMLHLQQKYESELSSFISISIIQNYLYLYQYQNSMNQLTFRDRDDLLKASFGGHEILLHQPSTSRLRLAAAYFCLAEVSLFKTLPEVGQGKVSLRLR